jgi:hypothetical protein
VTSDELLDAVSWILCTVWEGLALFLAAWIAIKHFSVLPTGWTTEDFFAVLMKTHMNYFAA